MSSSTKTTENLVVIGNGLAGVSAAIRARDLGANVTVVSHRDGATALSSGAFDICRDPFGHPGDIAHWNINWQKNIETQISLNPHHPYSFSNPVKIRDSIKYFVRALEEVNFFIKVSAENNLLLPTPIGTWKETAGGQVSQVGINLFNITQEHIAILKIGNHTNFLPDLIASRFREYLADFIESPPSITVKEIELGLSQNLSDLSIAEMIETETGFEILLSSLKKVVAQEQPSLILSPPLLGLDNSHEIVDKLTKELGVPVVETIGYYESVPGIRLQRALKRVLEKKGINIIQGRVVGFSRSDSIINKLKINSENKDIELDVSGVILSTGKWIGGGVSHLNSLPIKETIFNLPLRIDNESLNGAQPWSLFSDRYEAKHKAMRVGVALNSLMQPIGSRGEILYDNLRGAGSIISSYDPHSEGCGSGVAVATGFLAAEYGTYK